MFQKFTLKEANDLLPEIIRITNETIEQLEATRARMEADVIYHGKEIEKSFHVRVNAIMESWARQISQLGVLPKGYFTCDFISPNPDTYFCWTYGEKSIKYKHKVTESFKDRVPIEFPELEGFEVSLN
ncbi:MAG: DUF2203 family protein [Calditrichaeota bacterium]|nr:MAG: DUF2203 family protein [Calditrichota bacterium]